MLDVGIVFVVLGGFVKDFKLIGVLSIFFVLVDIYNMLDVPNVLFAAQPFLNKVGHLSLVVADFLLWLGYIASQLALLQTHVSAYVGVRNDVALLVGDDLLHLWEVVLRLTDHAGLGVVHLLLVVDLVVVNHEDTLLAELMSIGLKHIVLLVPQRTLCPKQEVILTHLMLHLNLFLLVRRLLTVMQRMEFLDFLLGNHLGLPDHSLLVEVLVNFARGGVNLAGSAVGQDHVEVGGGHQLRPCKSAAAFGNLIDLVEHVFFALFFCLQLIDVCVQEFAQVEVGAVQRLASNVFFSCMSLVSYGFYDLLLFFLLRAFVFVQELEVVGVLVEQWLVPKLLASNEDVRFGDVLDELIIINQLQGGGSFLGHQQTFLMGCEVQLVIIDHVDQLDGVMVDAL